MDPAAGLQLVYHIGRAHADKQHIGRRRLAAVSGLTEMLVRLELQRLREAGWVIVDRSGIELTESGYGRFASALDRIREVCDIDLTSLRLDVCTMAGHVSALTGDPGWTLRDLAIREGATGLLLIQYKNGSWRFTHNQELIALHNSSDEAVIQATFPNPVEQDQLILASAPDRRRAGLGLWHVIEAVVGDS